jgi:hypothetical protein
MPAERPISVADFAVPERRLAIYIDGAAFHAGERLRRDRYIRRRLRDGSPPWCMGPNWLRSSKEIETPGPGYNYN